VPDSGSFHRIAMIRDVANVVVLLAIAGLSTACQVSSAYTPIVPGPSAAFEMTCGNVSLNLGASGSVTTTCTVMPSKGFSELVSMGCAGLPTGSRCDFEPEVFRLSGATNPSFAVTITYQQTVPMGTYHVHVTGTAGTMSRSATVTLVKGTLG